MVCTKVLVCGSVDGKFSKFFKKVSSLNKKNGPFEMVICTGNFFTNQPECKNEWESFIKRSGKIDVPVYILGPTSDGLDGYYGSKEDIEDGVEIFENILYLGQKGIFKTTSGVVISYLGGCASSGNYGVKKSHVNALLEQVKKDDKFCGVDILLTSAWPKDVMKQTKSEIEGPPSSALVSLIAATLKPRYHLTHCADNFFERTPYRNHQVLQGQQEHVSRFLSLAPFGNSRGEKAIYAISLQPISSMSHDELVKQPDNVTEFPYTEVLGIAMSSDDSKDEKPQQFFFDTNSNKRKHGNSNDNQAKRTPKGPPTLKGDCWFCLGSKNVEKHLVVSVGEQCYVAVAKGAINKDHILICPVQHHNSTVVAPDDVVMEMEKYKMGLRKMFKEEGKHMVTYERNFYTQHLQLQVIGIPAERSDEVKDTFVDFAEESVMELNEMPDDQDISQVVAPTTPYFVVELPSGQRLLHKVKGKMPLQFGREVLTSPSLLNLPDRIDWKECKLTLEEESEMTKKFRKRFQPFDFNLT